MDCTTRASHPQTGPTLRLDHSARTPAAECREMEVVAAEPAVVSRGAAVEAAESPPSRSTGLPASPRGPAADSRAAVVVVAAMARMVVDRPSLLRGHRGSRHATLVSGSVVARCFHFQDRCWGRGQAVGGGWSAIHARSGHRLSGEAAAAAAVVVVVVVVAAVVV